MFEPSIIFQRSHSGRTEIHEKKNGLTQSERLVLIMIDGVTSYSGVRAKLPVLADERFERAMRTLLKKDLILEVFMPVGSAAPELVERTVIDRFLQQDALDPVTIFMLEDDERLGEPSRPAPFHDTTPAFEETRPPFIAAAVAPAAQANPPRSLATEAPVATMNEKEAELADLIGLEARTRQQERAAHASHQVKVHTERSTQKRKSRSSVPGESAHWGYWLIAIGTAFLLGYALARISA